ncbi:MAG TPA: hypothetical protein VFC76_01010 [Oscillospiraceae bacterium]|nr:hypothetical protein [Oscillospiraceae bacterium]
MDTLKKLIAGEIYKLKQKLNRLNDFVFCDNFYRLDLEQQSELLTQITNLNKQLANLINLYEN